MVDPQDKLDVKTLALFQLKDFCHADSDAANFHSDDTKEINFSSQDAINAMDSRQENMQFPGAKLI